MSEKSPCCSSGTAKEPVMHTVYDRSAHTVASHRALEKTIPLGTCAQQCQPNPIDLMSMGLASCLLIVMGKEAEARKLDFVGARADVSYDLVNYRIAQIKVALHLPQKLSAADQARLEAASRTCPVFLAIHPDVKVTVNYIWPE